MEKYIFTRENALTFGWEGLTGWSYSSKEDFPNASAAYFEITGLRASAQTQISDRIYYILEGTGKFIIDGNPLPVKATDVVIIPKGTDYGYEPDEDQVLKVFLIHTPAFEEEKEENLSNQPSVDLNNTKEISSPELLYNKAEPIV